MFDDFDRRDDVRGGVRQWERQPVQVGGDELHGIRQAVIADRVDADATRE